jgi:hypothetical protein
MALRKPTRLLLALLFIIGTAVSVSAAAQGSALAATSCYGSSCYGLSAAQTTCVKDAKAVSTFNDEDSQIKLYYSPSCRSAWARFVTEDNPEVSPNGWVVQSKGEDETCVVKFSGGQYGYGCNTKMVDDAGATSYAMGFFEFSGVYTSILTSSY